MTLQQLKYIIKIVECGSITEAARELSISQPTLSASVKDLEKEFHLEIFYRTPRGITLSAEGMEFLSYAKKVVTEADQMALHYTDRKPTKQLCCISTQHYAFAVNAFVRLLSSLDTDEYEFTLRETRTAEIIDDVANFRSEIGILYLSAFNEKALRKLFREKGLTFTPLFRANPHVFLSTAHPLAAKSEVTLEDLSGYPCLEFEQGTDNAFYFSEEILSTEPHKKAIHVSDRATLFNLLIGLNGYTICTGLLNSDLNGDNITAVPLRTEEWMAVGLLTNGKIPLSNMANDYVRELKEIIASA